MTQIAVKNKMRILKHGQNLCKRKQFQNKAQASFFAVIGVLLFIAAITGFFVYNNIKKTNIEQETKKAAEISLQAEEVKKFVNDCIRKASFEGLKTIGQTGGYVDVPKLISFKGTAMWQFDQANIQPFLNQTKEKLIQYVNENAPKCVENGNISRLGFSVEKSNPITSIEFGASDVTIKAVYHIKLGKENFNRDFSEFFNTFDIRYRSIFEAATEINTKLFDADFDANEPLKKLGYLKNLDFDVDYKTPETDVITFTITDKKSATPANEFYTFSFAAKLGKSELKKITYLQNKSATSPVFLPYTIFSTDKKAQLDISSGTSINLNGQPVQSIIVQQEYPQNVVAKNVPVEKENKEIKRREDLVYVTDNPIYNFEPDGLLFNKPQKLTLYYDDPKGKDEKGVGILMGKKGFWIPIPSLEDRLNKRVFTNIIGFTDFTAVFCASQGLRKTVARQVFEANAGCYLSLILFAVSLAAMVYFGPLIFSAISAGGGGSYFTVVGAQIAGQLGIDITVISASTLGIAYTAFSALALSVGLIGSATEAFYTSSPENCQVFIPTCTWQVGVGAFEKDGEGRCVPKSGTYQAGVPVTLCAQVEKCNFIEKFTCKKCSVECTAQFY